MACRTFSTKRNGRSIGWSACRPKTAVCTTKWRHKRGSRACRIRLTWADDQYWVNYNEMAISTQASAAAVFQLLKGSSPANAMGRPQLILQSGGLNLFAFLVRFAPGASVRIEASIDLAAWNQDFGLTPAKRKIRDLDLRSVFRDFLCPSYWKAKTSKFGGCTEEDALLVPCE